MGTELRDGYCKDDKRVKVQRTTLGFWEGFGIALLALFTCGLGALLFVGKLRPGPWQCSECGRKARAFELE